MRYSSKQYPAIVYLATNLLNGKRYIGVTTRALKKRRAEHIARALRGVSNSAFDRAIRKYGAAAFTWDVLVYCDTGNAALAEEIRLIAFMSPEYNATLGGDGNLGRSMSPEGRARLSKFHAGNQWHSGCRHTDATKRALAAYQAMPTAIVEWVINRAKGPAALSRRVTCLNDGRVFPSASEAAREYAVSKSALIELCNGIRGRQSVSGLKFSYVENA